MCINIHKTIFITFLYQEHKEGNVLEQNTVD